MPILPSQPAPRRPLRTFTVNWISATLPLDIVADEMRYGTEGLSFWIDGQQVAYVDRHLITAVTSTQYSDGLP